MPQLMPLYWIISSCLIILMLIMLIDLYYYNSCIINKDNFKIIFVNNKSYVW